MASSRAAVARALPITHSAPTQSGEGVEPPQAIKRRLGFDTAPSWIIVSEGNDFVWPGYDLRKRRKTYSYDYGLLPPRFFDKVVRAFVAWHQAHKALVVPRD